METRQGSGGDGRGGAGGRRHRVQVATANGAHRVALPSDYNLPGGNVTSLISSW